MIIIGIESSCDETAVAVVKDKKEVLSSVVASQIDVHTEFGGVVPEVASRIHVENISYCIEKALKDANITMEDVDAVAVTQGPGLIGCLHVGVQAAKTLAFAYHKPLVPVHHLAGHIYANELVVDMKYPVLALVVSGGNTELVYMKDETSFEILGETQDDAIGQAFDKVARANHNLKSPTLRPVVRDNIYKQIDKLPVNEYFESCMKVPFNIKARIKSMLPGWLQVFIKKNK